MANEYFKKTIYLKSTDSTNTYLKDNKILPDTIVYTFNQTKGRGRNQKNWIDFTNKNVAVSFTIKPDNKIINSIWLIATASLALIDILKKNKIKNYWIKWPNDVYINKYKLSGILAESVWQQDEIIKLIIGIGININCNKSDLLNLNNDATSLLLESGKEYNLEKFFIEYKNKISKWLNILVNKKNLGKIKKAWLKNCKIINKKVEWQNGSKTLYGIITDINDEGNLIFQNDDMTANIVSGDVKVL